jgi:hypothetical protein
MYIEIKSRAEALYQRDRTSRPGLRQRHLAGPAPREANELRALLSSGEDGARCRPTKSASSFWCASLGDANQYTLGIGTMSPRRSEISPVCPTSTRTSGARAKWFDSDISTPLAVR